MRDLSTFSIDDPEITFSPGSSTPPTTTLPISTTTSDSGGPTSTSVPDAGNPFTGYSVREISCPRARARLIDHPQVWLTPFYADEVNAAAANITDATVKAKALKVAQIPTFTWLDAVAKVPNLGDYLTDAEAKQKSTGQKQLVQIVVYDLPDRDCAALASNGEFSIANDGVNKYKDYIDQIAAQIQSTFLSCSSPRRGLELLLEFPDVRVVAVIEPDSLANLVTNLNVQKCANAQSAYMECVLYAIQKLNALGVYMYLDAGHAGWLGWPANLTPAAQLFSQLYASASRPEFLRGLATNVANFNALNAASPDPITQGNSNYDEMHYINVNLLFLVFMLEATSYYFVRPLLPYLQAPASPLTSLLIKVDLAYRILGNSGVTGATLKVLALVPILPPALVPVSLIQLFGSSPVVNVMVPPTPLPLALIHIALFRK